MYENFEKYWDSKSAVFMSLGLTMEVAKMIWDDAMQNFSYQLILSTLKEKAEHETNINKEK